MDPHLVFAADRFSAFCEKCSGHTDMPHVIGLAVFCAVHCPTCNPVAPAERTGAVVTLEGEQGGLFK